VAAFVSQPVWAAIAGAGLALVYWALDALTWRRARERRDLALGLAVSGMFIRLLVVVAGLIVIGVLDRPSFAAAALSFLAAFTVYVLIRPMTYPQASPSAGHLGAHR
jgi:tetrahydromethanopterin S-methyltransferase subunit D